jgi:hypothetical protein
MAAIPSSRPVKPSRSDVVALTLMRPASSPMIASSRACIAAAWGPIFGRSQISVTSPFATR